MRRSVSSERFEIAGPAGPLEALIDTPQVQSPFVAVICHPHPLHGGTMDNKVAHTLARSFFRLGLTAVRFNFRGVGRSGGSHADGIGEREDLLAVANWAKESRPGSELFLAGFSFGAMVALMSLRQLQPRGLVAVAPPVSRLPEPFEPPQCPWVIVHGEKDELVPLESVQKWRASNGESASLAVVEGATHFFHGKLNALAEEVDSFIRPLINGRPNDADRT